MLTLKWLLSSIAAELRYKYNSASDTNIPPERLALMKREINKAATYILRSIPASTVRITRNFLLPAKYTTGTVTVTQGSRTVTGSGTNWTKSLQRSQFKVDGDKVIYGIKAVVSATSLLLEDVYIGASGAGKSYALAVWRWALPIMFAPPLDFVFCNESKVTILSKDDFERRYSNPTSFGTPSAVTVGMVSRSIEQSDGTVSLTQGSSEVTGTGTSFSDDDVGKVISVTGYLTPYIITKVTSATSIFISPTWQDITVYNKAYELEHSPAYLMEFNSAPATAVRLRVGYGWRPSPVYDDNQRLEVPYEGEPLLEAMAKLLIIPKYSEDRLQLQTVLNEYRLATEATNLDPLCMGKRLYGAAPTTDELLAYFRQMGVLET